MSLLSILKGDVISMCISVGYLRWNMADMNSNSIGVTLSVLKVIIIPNLNENIVNIVRNTHCVVMEISSSIIFKFWDERRIC